MFAIGLAAASLAFGVLLVAVYAAWLATAPRRRCPDCGSASCRSSCASKGLRQLALPQSRPVLVVVPVFDEAALIERKLANLAALTYPHRRIALVDGGSTDGTLEILERSRFEVLHTTLRNKTAQLNEALRRYSEEEWIVVTDADALLEPDTIERLMRMTNADVGVVGASVRPESAHELEALHWRATDWLRDHEVDRGSAGIVAAPCYLARRVHLAEMPADTIADDVHVACRAMRAGQRVAHSDATVIELRSPRTLRDLVRHKFRKADAYLREIFRFLPHRMPAVFLWRATLLTIVPLLVVVAAPMTVFALLLKPTRLALVLTAVSLAALLAYPFSRQMASFPKIQYEEP